MVTACFFIFTIFQQLLKVKMIFGSGTLVLHLTWNIFGRDVHPTSTYKKVLYMTLTKVKVTDLTLKSEKIPILMPTPLALLFQHYNTNEHVHLNTHIHQTHPYRPSQVIEMQF